MPVPNNTLVQVQTYQKAELAWLLNSYCIISQTNKKFKNFDKSAPSNLGDTVNYDLPPRYITFNGLVITQQQSVQRLQPLICSQAFNVAAGYSDQQFIFNVREYMERFGESAVNELGSKVEADIAKNFISGVTINNPQDPNFGQIQTSSGPYRFYGDGVTPINSFGQLAQACANFRDFGAAKNKMRGFLPVTVVPNIVNSGLNQFAMNRNNEMANDWELGPFSGCEWYESNLLPVQVAGDIGNAAAPNNVVTVVSTNDPTGNNVTAITFTEPTGGTDANAVFSGDLFQFNDGVSGQPNMRFLTFIGHNVCSQNVQFRATAQAGTTSGTFTVNITPPLVWAQNENQNLNNAIAAGMKCTILPTHRAGLIDSGDQFYLAMPVLPDQEPFSTVNTMDKNSGASIRHYWGVQFGQNVRTYVRDEIHGSTLNQDNSMRLCFPV
jgi:hypothetical protein